jgi:hypothetical protein
LRRVNSKVQQKSFTVSAPFFPIRERGKIKRKETVSISVVVGKSIFQIEEKGLNSKKNFYKGA